MATKEERQKMARFEDYKGYKAWRVEHPNFGHADVLAPCEAAAIVTAAKKWGQRWQKYAFYPYCNVMKI